MFRKTGLFLVVLLFSACNTPVYAEEPDTLAHDLVHDVVLNPGTYQTATWLWISARLDWNSSQTLFNHGDLEDNPRFTISGLPHDAPVSYGAGNRQILTDALVALSVSAAHNALVSVGSHVLIKKFPEHRKLIRALTVAEMLVVEVISTYELSHRHFEQWRWNIDEAARKGN